MSKNQGINQAVCFDEKSKSKENFSDSPLKGPSHQIRSA
jgi:hypothetical protein